jgi:hypothetical protein
MILIKTKSDKMIWNAYILLLPFLALSTPASEGLDHHYGKHFPTIELLGGKCDE